MWNFKQAMSAVGGALSIKAKRYVGILHGNLPVNARKWTSSSFLNALDVSLYTDKAISKRADKVGDIEFLLRDARGDEIESDPILDLLNKPNRVFDGQAFWKLYQQYYDAVGEVYIFLEHGPVFQGKPKVTGMHLLNPLAVEPKFDDMGNITSFKFKLGGTEKIYQPEQIIYIHNPNPQAPLRGRSLLKSGVDAIQTETQISTYHSRILENGGKVEGVFKFKTPALSEDQLATLKKQYQKEYGKAARAGLPMFMGGDADYIKTGLSPNELAFLDTKKLTLEDICIMTSVPKSMLASTNDVKFDNADADRAIFLRETIKPLLTILTNALDKRLFPDDKTLTFVDPTPENIDRMLKEIESGMKNYYMTPNEAREMRGMDPIDGGDQLLIPFNLLPAGSSGTNTDEKGIKRKATKIEHPLQDAEVREVYGRMQIKRMDQRENGFKKDLRKYFDEQAERIIEQLQPEKNYVFRKKELVDDIFNIELEVKVGKDNLLPALTDLLEQAGIDAVELAGADFQFNLSADIRSWINNHSDVFLQSINEVTLEKLRGEFEASLAASEGREQLIKRVEDTYGNIKKNRAALIARTEVHNATQFGTLEGYKQAGLEIKIWVAVGDAATRSTHFAIDGEERPIGQKFSNGLNFPGDPTGPAEETINCRCVI